MASISTQLQLNDHMSTALKKINQNIDALLGSFAEMQRVSGTPVNVDALARGSAAAESIGRALEECAQNTKRAINEQEAYNQKLQGGKSAADGMHKMVKQAAIAVGGIQAVKGIFNLSDDLAGAQARLSLVVDDGGSVDALQKKIFDSAQAARGSYLDTMNTVSKLGLMAGDAFSGNDEMIRFSELMNKNFVIAGASAQEQSSAMYQLTQAMASGRLQGDEYRSIIENAPLLAQSIEEYMRASGVEGTMKDWAADGLLTAEVIKNALFMSADEIDERFSQMPQTFSQIWTSFQNNALMAFQPVLSRLNELANSADFQNLVNGAMGAIAMIAGIVLEIFSLIAAVGGFIAENWSIIEPIIMGIVLALGLYYGAMLLYNSITAISAGITSAKAFADKVHAASLTLQKGATFAATAAQHGFNAALLACPLTWIIILIIALVAVFYAVVAAVNHFAGTSVSATGIICGAFMVALAFIGNLFVTLINTVIDLVVVIWNVFAAFVNFLANVFTDPIGAIARLFFDLVDVVLSLLQTLASAIDTIFGSNLAGSVQGWRDSLGGWVDETFGKDAEIKLNAEDMHLKRFEYGEAWDSGYSFGEGVEKKIGGMFDFGGMGDTAAAVSGATPAVPDYGAIAGNTGDIADNTGTIAENTAKSEEDLKLLREIAEREAINRFTTSEVKVDMTGMSNTIASDMDIDGFMSVFTERFEEALLSTAEGVHA